MFQMECITEVQFFLDLVLDKYSRKFEASLQDTLIFGFAVAAVQWD